MSALRLGLLSTAAVNGAILHAAAATDAVEVTAVGSRDAARARAYGEQHGIARAHGSYQELLADPQVDAVYVSLPNGLHVEWSIRALEAGKHVLCEKPMARRAEEVERAFAVAQRSGRVLTEAFMWRHHPQTRRLVELVAEGAVGPLRLVRATFGFGLDRPGDVRWSPALEGGALMDVGCYCVSAARLLAGEPERAEGAQVLGGGGVDARFAGVLRFPGDVLALIDCGLDLPPRHGLEVVGAEGTLVVSDPFHARDPGLQLRRTDGRVERVEVPEADPYALELEDLARAAAGQAAPLLGREDAVGQARAIELLYASAQRR